MAVALKHGLDGDIGVALLDPGGFEPRPDDLRAYALAAGVRRMYEQLGLWAAMEPEAEPMRSMVLTDTALGEPVRPSLLSFDGDLPSGEPFAHMLANRWRCACLAGRRGPPACG